MTLNLSSLFLSYVIAARKAVTLGCSAVTQASNGSGERAGQATKHCNDYRCCMKTYLETVVTGEYFLGLKEISDWVTLDICIKYCAVCVSDLD